MFGLALQAAPRCDQASVTRQPLTQNALLVGRAPNPAPDQLRAAARCAQAGSRSKKPRISDAIMEFQCAGDPDHRAGLRSRARSRFVLVVQTSSFQEERARALRSEDVLSGLAVEGQAVGLASIRSCILEAQRVQNYTPELGHCNLW